MVFILGILEASNFDLMSLGFKDARKRKVFEWQTFLILIVLHALNTSTSFCSIIPGGTGNVDF